MVGSYLDAHVDLAAVDGPVGGQGDHRVVGVAGVVAHHVEQVDLVAAGRQRVHQQTCYGSHESTI